MANYSDLTRKEQVLAYLEERKGTWVNGPEIATEEIGGSEGLKRLRELRADGYAIFGRKHPDPDRDIWQYMFVDKPPARPTTPLREDATPATPATPAAAVSDGTRMTFGTHRLCHTCRAMRKSCNVCGGKGFVVAQPGT